MCLVFLPFGKMLSKKKHIADNFLLKFQDEDKRFVNIYHFGIEPMGFQTPLTLELLSKTIINPDCCKGKYPRVNVVNESVNKLFETCGSEEKQNNLQIVTYTIIIMPVCTQNFLEILSNVHCVDFTHVNTVTIYHAF